jgi:S-DNA-T family DNA segregation ATPase FtsK/SpoIIIE
VTADTEAAKSTESDERRGLFHGTSRTKKRQNRREKLPLISRVYISDNEEQMHKSPVRENVHPQSRGKKVGISTKKTAPGPVSRQPSSAAVGASSYLRKSNPINKREQERETERKAQELERTLKEFGIDAKVTGIIMGPVITRYELQPAPGVKLSRIENLSNNIALSLSANGVRIEAPIPGRAAVGIEIPNDEREVVTLGDILESATKKGELPLVLGKDISGETVVSDLCSMPHLLIAGATGAGKSVCVNSLIMSMISQKSPEQVRLLMIDPKMVELKIYNGIPHLLTEVVTDPRDAAKALRWVIFEMENRYRLLDENYVRNISSYNRKMREPLPYIVIIVDEFANLMAISQKEVEDAVVRLAAMSRAVGIHLIMATQRPSVDVITGLIKANFPFRIAFQVASKMDSRTILDTVGAEKLLGSGDMLFAPAGSMNIQRIQGAFISEEEVVRIVRELKKKAQPEYVEDMFSHSHEEGPAVDFEDPLLDQAIEIVLNTKRASASFLQRRLKIGYNRSARLIELMEEKGIIGPPRGSKPREIYIDRID